MVVPPGPVRATRIVPPCAAVICVQIANPSPVPFDLVV
jgi:hypothetical protein